MSVNLLLRRRANMAANSNNSSGGGDTPGGGEESDIIYLDMTTEHIGEYEFRLIITSESLIPYDFSISLFGSNSMDSVAPTNIYLYYGNTVNEDLLCEITNQNGDYPPNDTVLGVRFMSPIDTNYRIIPSHICLIAATTFLEYLYTTNIDKIPISPDDMGANAEICPIKMIFRVSPLIDNTSLDLWVWYNYNDEILFKNLYTGLIYALNSYGDFYQWN